MSYKIRNWSNVKPRNKFPQFSCWGLYRSHGIHHWKKARCPGERQPGSSPETCACNQVDRERRQEGGYTLERPGICSFAFSSPQGDPNSSAPRSISGRLYVSCRLFSLLWLAAGSFCLVTPEQKKKKAFSHCSIIFKNTLFMQLYRIKCLLDFITWSFASLTGALWSYLQKRSE